MYNHMHMYVTGDVKVDLDVDVCIYFVCTSLYIKNMYAYVSISIDGLQATP